MGRLIDANALLDLYNMAAIEESGEYGQGCLDIIDDIRNAPTVDAVPVVHGRWVNDQYCSECGYSVPTDAYGVYLSVEDNEFCYNCGAKMDKGE